MSKLIILFGIPGSGKTTWRNEYMNNRIKPEHTKVICPDDLRREIAGDVSNISKDSEVWQKAYKLLNEYLTDKKDVIFDSTACSARTQQMLEEIGKKYNSSVEYKIFDVDLPTAKGRIMMDILNKVDRSHVPEFIVESMYKNFQELLVELKKRVDTYKVKLYK